MYSCANKPNDHCPNWIPRIWNHWRLTSYWLTDLTAVKLSLWQQSSERTKQRYPTAGGETVGNFAETPSSWSHLSLHNLLFCTLHPLSLSVTVPCLSSLHHSIPLSFTFSVCVQLSPFIFPLNSLFIASSPVHLVPSICSDFRPSPQICRRRVKTEWGHHPFYAAPPVKCPELRLPPAPPLPPSFSLVLQCMGGRFDYVYFVKHNMMPFSTFELRSIVGRLQVLARSSQNIKSAWVSKPARWRGTVRSFVKLTNIKDWTTLQQQPFEMSRCYNMNSHQL